MLLEDELAEDDPLDDELDEVVVVVLASRQSWMYSSRACEAGNYVVVKLVVVVLIRYGQRPLNAKQTFAGLTSLGRL